MRRPSWLAQRSAVGAFLAAFACAAQPLSISTLAGTGSIGNVNGPARSAKFADPSGVAVSRWTNVFVADTYSNVIRIIIPDATGTNWSVNTIAGQPGASGHVDGSNNAARFNNPTALAVDAFTNIYLADTANNQIRRLTPDAAGTNWSVVTIAGTNTAEAGAANGTNGTALFNNPAGITLDLSGHLFVADRVNNTIRKMAPDSSGTNWVVTTLAGTAGQSGFHDGAGNTALFSSPNSVACDAGGNIYVADGGNCAIRQITPSGNVTTIAGSQPGFADGVGTNAQFDFPCGIVVDAATNIFVSDFFNNTIRRITRGFSGWTITTVAGNPPLAGNNDGVASQARFQFANSRSNPNGLALDVGARLFIADSANSLIRIGANFAGLILLSTPASQTIVAGANLTLTANAAGTLPISYQWLKNGNPIIDSTNAALTLPNLQTNAAGSYSVIVSNSVGHSNSPPAVITVVLPFAIATVAGVGATGTDDGFGVAARFGGIAGVAVDSRGNVLIADSSNHAIRKISSLGQVTTLAGSPQVSGAADGQGGAARFNFPCGVAVDAFDNSYVADTSNCLIREISTSGTVNTIYGAGSPGYRDGPASQSLFNFPRGIVINASGVIYVADTLNNRIRALANGFVTTFAGDGSPGAVDAMGTNAELNQPFALACDLSGNLFVADCGNSVIRKITPAGTVTTIAGSPGQFGYSNGTNSSALFDLPSGIAVDASENVYVADFANHVIRQITPSANNIWTVSSLAGFPQVFGDSDGAALGARFHGPFGLAVDSLGIVYVGDSANGIIRKVTSAGVVSTLAGPSGSFGQSDGVFPGGRLNGPRGVAVDLGGNIFAADTVNNTIRRITPDGNMSTISGLPGFGGANNGEGSDARFSQPSGLAVDASSNVYVADFQNSIIRKLSFDPLTGNWASATIAGVPGSFGYSNGPDANALFDAPWAVAVDSSGDIYVSDYSNQVIRLILPSGNVSLYAGSPNHAGYGDSPNVFFNFPAGIALDTSRNLYVADSKNQLIRKITPAGSVSTVAGVYFTPGSADGPGSAAQLNNPEGVAADTLGNIFVADTGNNSIREITAAGTVVTVAAVSGARGSRDGVWTDAQFNGPVSIALDHAGNFIIADALNNTIRTAISYYGQPIILTPPYGRSVPFGAPVTLIPKAAGAAPLSYHWLQTDFPLASQTNLALAISAAQSSDSGNYQLIVSNTFGADASATAPLNVFSAPQIFAQPGNQTATLHSAPSFSVTAFGALPLSYQWNFNGSAIENATNSILTIHDAQTSDAGSYQVSVQNASGKVVSLLAELILAAPPQLLSGPSSVTGQCGSNVVLSVNASSPPLNYQWFAGSTPMALATLPSLTVSNLVDGQSQNFHVVVSNSFGAVTSDVATINVIDTTPPLITLAGAVVTNILVGSAYADPGATADDLCSGATTVSATGSINTNVVGTYAISYRAVDSRGNAATASRTVNVVPARPIITTQPSSQLNYPGATQTISVSVTGQTPLSFQWYRNGAKLTDGGIISGSTNQTLSIGPLSAANAGTYFVLVTNSAGAATSSNAVLTIGAAGTPVTVTGFNRDVIVENIATSGNTAGYAQAFDPTYPTFCIYESGLDASNVYGNSPTNLGLVPNGSYVSAVDGATVFQFAPYAANNVLYLTEIAPADSLNLAAPSNFNTLSILAASADGGGEGSWAIQFSDGTSSPFFDLNAPDWQGTSGGAVTHFGELYNGNYGHFYAYNLVNNFPSLYQTTINLAELGLNLKTVAALNFSKVPGSSTITGIFAVSGTVGPLPFESGPPSISGNYLVFSLQIIAGQNYSIQETTNLSSANWETFSNFTGTGAPKQFTVPLTNRQEFFRIIEP